MEQKSMNQIILVDEKDNQIGVEEKLKAHLEGKFHRAFSVFVFNSKGELMLQKRAQTKYHSGGLWSNTCCSHPRPDKDITEEAKTRLKEEMGIDCELKEAFSTSYNVKVDSQTGKLMEHEFDHIFIGLSDDSPELNPEEAEDWKWINPNELKKDIEENPEKYTPWFKLILERTLQESKNL